MERNRISNTTSIEALNSGDMFIYDNSIFIKPHLLYDVNDAGINAIRLDTGEGMWIFATEEIINLNCHLVMNNQKAMD